MRYLRFLAVAVLLAAPAFAATFGTVVATGASYGDIVLDNNGRNQVYLVNSALSQIEIYSTTNRQAITTIATGAGPESAAISPDGNFLYVTAYSASALDIIDLTKNSLVNAVTLPASPEGVAVGNDGRVLISAVPIGTNTTNTLLIYDPSTGLTSAVAVTPPAPTPSVLPPPNNRAFNSARGRLLASPDGTIIVGSNGTSTTAKVVFVYQVASGTVLLSRAVANLSSTLAVAPDNSKFMAGSTLFDATTLQVLAQENAANAPFAFPTGTASNFNLQANQGGSVFTPDGSAIYAAFNIAPVGSATGTHTVELLVNDPNNLLIRLGIQLPENLAGKMVIDAAGNNIYALSDSGFTVLPIGTIAKSPLAQPNSQIVLLTSDSCGVYSSQRASTDVVNNLGSGRFTATLQAYTAGATTVTGPGGITGIPGLGGAGGAGGGIIIVGPGGGGVVIPGGGGFPGGGGAFGGGGTTTTTPAAATTTGPLASVTNGGSAVTLNFQYNPAASASPGTIGPSDFTVLSPEAINIPGNVHTYQNNRSPESLGSIVPIALNASAGEGLTDIIFDSVRQRVYLANSGLNRIEVYDIQKQQLTTPISVGQLPHGMALSSDGVTLYVANTGGESISVVNLDQAVQTGRVVFPALPFNASVTLSTPQTIAAAGRGPQFVMSDGSVWKVDGAQAIPRALNPTVFGSTARTVSGGNPAIWSMAATPGGEYVMLMTGTGNAYLYDDSADNFTLARAVLTTPLTGYVGPVTAGPLGRFFAVGGAVLNTSLAPITAGSGSTSPLGRPVAAVTAVSANSISMFSLPVRTSATSAVTDAGLIETYIVGNNSNVAAGTAPTLEGAPSTVTGTARVTAFARTMAVDPTTQTAYVISASGLSIIPLAPAASSPATRPAINSGGVVGLADYTSPLAAGGLVTIFGRNLSSGTATTTVTPLPTILGNTCVTLNNTALPLSLASAGQINAQIPITLAAGSYPLVVHNISASAASVSTTIRVAKYAPAVLIGGGGQAAITHLDGSFVNKDNPASRDEVLSIYAIGLGPTTGGTVVTGRGAPSSPLAEVCADTAACAKTLQVFFGPPGDTRSPVIVQWSGLVPGLVGVYQANVYVPGTHISGDTVPVTLKIGGVSSSATGPEPPTVAVN